MLVQPKRGTKPEAKNITMSLFLSSSERATPSRALFGTVFQIVGCSFEGEVTSRLFLNLSLQPSKCIVCSTSFQTLMRGL